MLVGATWVCRCSASRSSARHLRYRSLAINSRAHFGSLASRSSVMGGISGISINPSLAKCLIPAVDNLVVILAGVVQRVAIALKAEQAVETVHITAMAAVADSIVALLPGHSPAVHVYDQRDAAHAVVAVAHQTAPISTPRCTAESTSRLMRPQSLSVIVIDGPRPKPCGQIVTSIASTS